MPLSEVFAVVPHKIKAAQSTEGEIELTSLKSSSFCIYAVKRTRKHKWRDKVFVFDCDDACLCQEWIDSIQNILSGNYIINYINFISVLFKIMLIIMKYIIMIPVLSVQIILLYFVISANGKMCLREKCSFVFHHLLVVGCNTPLQFTEV